VEPALINGGRSWGLARHAQDSFRGRAAHFSASVTGIPFSKLGEKSLGLPHVSCFEAVKKLSRKLIDRRRD